MGHVEGEETRRVVMDSQSIGDLEAKAMAVTRSYPNPRSDVRGDQANPNRCEFCKKEGHHKEECWCLYPNLRPKGGYKGGFKGGNHRQGEKYGEHRENRQREEKRGYSAQMGSAQEIKHEPTLKQVAEPNLDQMRQMIQQLSVTLQTNTQQFNGTASNLATNFLNTN
jgi:hypothetical protein